MNAVLFDIDLVLVSFGILSEDPMGQEIGLPKRKHVGRRLGQWRWTTDVSDPRRCHRNCSASISSRGSRGYSFQAEKKKRKKEQNIFSRKQAQKKNQTEQHQKKTTPSKSKTKKNQGSNRGEPNRTELHQMNIKEPNKKTNSLKRNKRGPLSPPPPEDHSVRRGVQEGAPRRRRFGSGPSPPCPRRASRPPRLSSPPSTNLAKGEK